MAELDSFLKLLDQTIKAPRLSGTKVQALSTQAKSLPSSSDTKVVSTFLKLNNSLPPLGQSRISSLYIFDAIARANKGVKGREGLLNKMEGVVDSWVGGMIDDGKGAVWTEGKDKTRKIIEIWTKNATFPPGCLDRLSQRLIAVPSSSAISTTPPPPIMSPALPPLSGAERKKGNDQGTSTPPVAPGSLPPEIQKLLGISTQAQPQPNTNGASTPRIPIIPSASQGQSGGGGVDLASILAGIANAKQTQTTPPNSAPTHATLPAPSASTGINVGGQTFNLDPTQLLALANLAKVQHPAPFPAQTGSPLPHASNAAYAPPNPSFPPFPPNPSGPSNFGRPPASIPPPPGSSQYPSGPPGPPFSGSQGYRDRSPPRRSSQSRDERDRFGHSRRFSDDRRGNGGGVQGDYSGPGRGRDRSRSPGAGRGGSTDWDDRAPTDWAEPMRGGDDRSGRGREGFRGRGRGRGRGGGPPPQSRDDGYPPHIPQSRPPPQHSLPPLPRNTSLPSAPGPYPSQVQGQARPTPPTGRAGLPNQPGKDEFGRDLPSSSNDAEGEEDMALDNSDDEGAANGSAVLTSRPVTTQFPPQQAPSPTYAPQQSQQPQHSYPSQPSANQSFGGQNQFQPKTLGPSLETFDKSTFNPADPASWASLAAAWQNSTGRQPDQMELMQFLAGGMEPNGGTNGGGGQGSGSQGLGGFGGYNNLGYKV